MHNTYIIPSVIAILGNFDTTSIIAMLHSREKKNDANVVDVRQQSPAAHTDFIVTVRRGGNRRKGAPRSARE